jgi:predicted alpha/beta superfamily hydrolase
MREYGVANHPDYKNRGDNAATYSKFITFEMIPFMIENYRIDIHHPDNAVAGFSMGGLSALDIAWNFSEIFHRVGVFSGSLWWRDVDYKDGYTDADRIMHEVIRQSDHQPELKFWFQTGGKDETADRNGNGIIDAIDDTLDLISELVKKGYRPYRDISYLEIKNGYHNQQTWGKAMPYFLQWAFAKK